MSTSPSKQKEVVAPKSTRMKEKSKRKGKRNQSEGTLSTMLIIIVILIVMTTHYYVMIDASIHR
jgi:hypothetical protein